MHAFDLPHYVMITLPLYSRVKIPNSPDLPRNSPLESLVDLRYPNHLLQRTFRFPDRLMYWICFSIALCLGLFVFRLKPRPFISRFPISDFPSRTLGTANLRRSLKGKTQVFLGSVKNQIFQTDRVQCHLGNPFFEKARKYAKARNLPI